MTTVLNGTDVIHNRSGKTIDSYIANGNNVTSSTTNIIKSAGLTIALLSVTGSDYACNLPNNLEIGDRLEVYCEPAGGWFYLPIGDTLLDGVSDRGSINIAAIFIKVAIATWLKLTI